MGWSENRERREGGRERTVARMSEEKKERDLDNAGKGHSAKAQLERERRPAPPHLSAYYAMFRFCGSLLRNLTFLKNKWRNLRFPVCCSENGYDRVLLSAEWLLRDVLLIEHLLPESHGTGLVDFVSRVVADVQKKRIKGDLSGGEADLLLRFQKINWQC